MPSRSEQYKRNAARILRRAALIVQQEGVTPTEAIWAARLTVAGVWEGDAPAPARAVIAGYAFAEAERSLCTGRPLEWWQSRQRSSAETADTMRRVADQLDPPPGSSHGFAEKSH